MSTHGSDIAGHEHVAKLCMPEPAVTARRTLVIDRTHLGRRASGIERITEELFSDIMRGACNTTAYRAATATLSSRIPSTQHASARALGRSGETGG